MRLSVIIPCFNATNVIEDQLHALTRQEWEHNWEIVISDNGSNTNLNEIVDSFRGKLPPVSVVDATAKKGAAYARNTGARHARGEYLVFVDADDMVGENWIQHIGYTLKHHDFVASRMDFSKLNSPEVLRTRRNNQDKGFLQFSVVQFLPSSSASGLGIRKEIHDMIGGYDEDMKSAAGEDTDYCWRIQLAGYPLHLADQAVMHYRFRDTLWKSFKQAKKYGEYNVFLYKKYQEYINPKQNKKKAIREWKKLLREIPSLHRNSDRSLWFRRLGEKIGRLKGSIKYGIFVP